MSGTLSATTLGALAPYLKDATTVASAGSTAYNLYNQYQQQQYQNQLRSLAEDPAKMNAYATKFTQPLNAGLTTGVANQAQSYLASRGLSDSPQISQQVEAQAIAPYIQQNQQQGYQNALQALQLGGGAINPALQQQNGLSALTKAFSQLPGQDPNLAGASALTRLMQLVNAGNVVNPPQTTPSYLDSSSYIPPVPDNQTLDLSSIYQQDPATYSGGGSDQVP